MQYHLNGFHPGDPAKSRSDKPKAGSDTAVDVLIVGCGPAGLTLAAQLSAFPDIATRIVEQKSGPLQMGQADGIACRSMEMFEAFGFAEKVEKEAYWVNETCFWRPDNSDGLLARADRIQDVEDGLSEFPHTILSQARVHDFFLEVMENSETGLTPDYNRRFRSVEQTNHPTHPLSVTLEPVNGAQGGETLFVRYLVGCDGARSAVRQAMGHRLEGKSARQLWGVMDVLAVTDFPDIRLKCAIQSEASGSLLIIPREGGYLVRMYIELDELHDGERAADRNLTVEQLIDNARAILAPYQLDVKEVAWWSAYEIGQRVCHAFDNFGQTGGAAKLPNMFIVGDACHTHSPKAGQGMNVSMADSFNLGWKLASVIRGQAKPELLRTYSSERQAKAKELIDFDRDMARLFSEKADDPDAADQFQRYFAKHARYTAGVETRYDGSVLTSAAPNQALAAGFAVGKRFHSAPVIRLADAKPMHLGHVLKADGRWRLILFGGADDRGTADRPIALLCDWLSSDPASPVRQYTPASGDVDHVLDVRVVFQAHHRALDLREMGGLLLPSKGRYGLIDYEKLFCPAAEEDLFDTRTIDRTQGAMVVVRPDQFVAHILPLTDTDGLADFFTGFMIPADGA